MSKLIKTTKTLLPYLSIPLIILAAIALISIANRPPLQNTVSNYGEFDLRGSDFENYVILISGVVEYIPNALLTPDEFDAWASENETSFGWIGHYSFATSRIRIYVEDGKWYTFSRYSTDYSHRIFVNGEWLLDIGRPGETPETDIPNTGRITFTAQGIDGVIEIVQQSSNHVHRNGGMHLWWSVGTGTTVSDWARAEQYQTAIILGSFMMLTLLFLVLFFTHRRNFANLFFAIFCFVWFMRMGVVGGRLFTVIIPWLDWVCKFRIEYIAIPASAMLTLAIVDIIFKNAMHKIVLKFFYCISSVFILLFLVLDTVVMSHLLDFVFVTYFAAILWLLGCLLVQHPMNQKKLGQTPYSTEQIMLGVGLILFIFAAVIDFGYVNAFFYIPYLHMTGVAVLVFALCEAVAVFTSTMNKFEEAIEKQLKEAAQNQRLAAENATFDSLSRLKSNFLNDISHEMKTPLTLMIGYAGLVKVHISENIIGSGTMENLNIIEEEASRLHLLVERLLNWSPGKSGAIKGVKVLVPDILSRAAAICTPIIAVKDNKLETSAEKDCPPVYANPDMILQVLFSLSVNAGRHTSSGVVKITARPDGGMVVFTVKDNGIGIAPDILANIFERGVSGDGGTGYGLAICKDAITSSGGTIDVKSQAGSGATVTFTLPIYSEDLEGLYERENLDG